MRTVLMLGEAGVGKTRTASELGLRVEALERRLRSFSDTDVREFGAAPPIRQQFLHIRMLGRP
jgi:hypothetical protein